MCVCAAVCLTHILVAHVPVGPLSERHHLPHDNAVTPHIAGRGELAEGDGLGGRPADRDFTTLCVEREKRPRTT